MFSFFRKKKKKVYDKWILFIVATVVVAAGIGNELMKGTNATELPVNDAFDDMSFYMCVVDAYNNEKVETAEEREYTDNLTDEELAVITYLNCSAIGNGIDEVEKIKSTKGIEKLVSLVDLQLFEHDITSIDLSRNILLENLYLNDNQLVEINVSQNDKLLTLNIQNNKLTSIDVSNNVELQSLNLSENQLTSIDVSNNVNLLGLYVNNNQLSELDLTNNNKLEFVVSLYNNFSKTFNLYKGENITLESVDNIIKLPSEMTQDLFSWLLWDIDSSNIISLDDTNVVSALSGGTMIVLGGVDHDDITNMEEDISYFLIDNMINVIDISSDEYIINQDNNFVYIGNDELDVNKINVVGFNLTVEDNKLKIINEEEKLITELDILGVDFGNLNIKNNAINITSEVTYEDFIANVDKSDKLSYNILNSDDELIETGNLLGGEKIEIYYGDILLDSYNVILKTEIDEEITFNDSIILNEENNYVKYLEDKSSVSEFLSMITMSDDLRKFISDKNGNEKNEDNMLVTGDILTIFDGSEKIYEYEIAVNGDANGDGNISLTDLSQMRKHIVGKTDENTGVIYKKEGIYYNAIDINNDNNVSLSDLSKMRKIIAGGENNE